MVDLGTVHQQIATQLGVDLGSLTPEQKDTLGKLNSQEEISLFLANVKENAGGAASAVQEKPGNSVFAGTGLEAGTGVMKSKKEYRAERKDLQQKFFDEIHNDGEINEYTMKMAKKHAKGQIAVQRAADRVLASVYFTPDQKEDFKAQKKELEKAGKRPVLLTKDDMELLNQPEFAEAWKTDANGKKVLDSEQLKLIASQRLGTDNELEMEERRAETEHITLDAKGKTGGKVTHKNARQAKNLYKHLGFDYQKDLTETKRAAVVVGSTLLGATGGGLIANAAGSKVIEGAIVNIASETIDGGGGVIMSGYDKLPDQVVKRIKPAVGATIGGVVGAVGGFAASQAINDLKRDNDILGGMDVATFVQNRDVKGVKKERNQLMMQRIFQMADEKKIPNEALTNEILAAQGDNQCLNEKELIKLFNKIKQMPDAVPDNVDNVDNSDHNEEIEGFAHEHEETVTQEPNYILNTRGVGMSQYVAAAYGVPEGSKAHKAILAKVFEENPGLRNHMLSIGDKVFLPNVDLGDGVERTPDLDKQPGARKLSKGPKLDRYGNERKTSTSTYWAPGTKEQHRPDENRFGTKKEAEDAHIAEQQEQRKAKPKAEEKPKNA